MLSGVYAQTTYNIANEDNVQMDCAAGPHLTVDSGDEAANYSGSEDYTATYCPGPGISRVSLLLSDDVSAGYVFDIDPSDTLYVYDGNSTAAPLIGKFNNNNMPSASQYDATWGVNASGCITIRFVSDASMESAGWKGQLTCGNLQQPFDYGINITSGQDMTNDEMTAIVQDTGYINVCQGEIVNFEANLNFPYSSDVTGVGYSQNTGNVTVEWDVNNVLTTGLSASLTASQSIGYLVKMTVTDAVPYDFVKRQLVFKVRVSPTPLFGGTRANPDTLCLGGQSELIGGVSASDTVGAQSMPSSISASGTFGQEMYLPDGSGAQYQTTVDITTFPAGYTIQSAYDISEICVEMSHTYNGDLEAAIECPNGQRATLFDFYSGGGFINEPDAGCHVVGCDVYLGNADDYTSNPGGGFQYCFNPQAGNVILKNAPTILAGSPVSNSMEGGTYLPQNGSNDYASLIGCPVNGTWKIIIQDNIGQDDGYIYSWGIYFNPLFDPNAEIYETEIVSGQWVGYAAGDTNAIVQANDLNIGDNPFTFQVTDNYGCIYDTTINIYVNAGLNMTLTDSTACDGVLPFAGSGSPSDAQWSMINGDGVVSFSPSPNTATPTFNFDSEGVYVVEMFSPLCGVTETYTLYNLNSPVVNAQDYNVCSNDVFDLNATDYVSNTNMDSTLVTWHNGSNDLVITVDQTMINTYNPFSIQASNRCATVSENFMITLNPTPIINVPSETCPETVQLSGNADISGPIWSFVSGAGNAVFPNGNNVLNPQIVFDTPGNYVINLTDNLCGLDTSFNIFYFGDPTLAPYGDLELCSDENLELSIVNNAGGFHNTSYFVINNDTINASSINVSLNPGLYTDQVVYIANQCNFAIQTLDIQVYDCSVVIPNVMSINAEEEGLNTFFKITGIEYNPDLAVYIYNRWGNKVFESKGYQNDWAGKTKGGSLLNEGVYFYVVENPRNGDVYKGNVTIFHKREN